MAFFLRYDDTTSTIGYILTALGVLALGGTGAFGGHLAYHHRIGVEENPDLRPAARPTTASPSAYPGGRGSEAT